MSIPAPLRRLLPLILIGLGLALVIAFDLHRYLTFDSLRQHRAWLAAEIEANYVLVAVAYMAVYVGVVALSVPGAAALTIAGGVLFGAWVAAALVVVSATIGATLLFLAARMGLGDLLRRKAGPWMGKLERGFKENAFNYLLTLRLVPLFPFFIVNLVPALLGVRLDVFVLATFIGIIPGTIVFANVGAGLAKVLESTEVTPASILTPEILAALIGLGLLALLPVAYKAMRRRRGEE
jgi:uncharacterized membrane protein YdjX (TVP38/TMEM64 family)